MKMRAQTTLLPLVDSDAKCNSQYLRLEKPRLQKIASRIVLEFSDAVPRLVGCNYKIARGCLVPALILPHLRLSASITVHSLKKNELTGSAPMRRKCTFRALISCSKVCSKEGHSGPCIMYNTLTVTPCAITASGNPIFHEQKRLAAR
jgi:hypothetical protein